MDWSSELDTLEQLLGGDMRLSIIRRIYESDEHFLQGVFGLLRCGHVRLLDESMVEVPQWRWRPLFSDGEVLHSLSSFTLEITDAGAKFFWG